MIRMSKKINVTRVKTNLIENLISLLRRQTVLATRTAGNYRRHRVVGYSLVVAAVVGWRRCADGVHC